MIGLFLCANATYLWNHIYRTKWRIKNNHNNAFWVFLFTSSRLPDLFQCDSHEEALRNWWYFTYGLFFRFLLRFFLSNEIPAKWYQYRDNAALKTSCILTLSLVQIIASHRPQLLIEFILELVFFANNSIWIEKCSGFHRSLFLSVYCHCWLAVSVALGEHIN